jgi:FkbM family methyltransferase
MKHIAIEKIRDILLWVQAIVTRDPDRFFKKVSGVIHVGANTGQERDTYKKNGLRVLWIEPIPEVFEELKKNLANFPQQRALQYLVSERDDVEYQFNIASNNGLSSSILDFKLHKDIWPHVSYKKTIALRSKTLTTLLEHERIEPREYDALIMDTQGSELLVLKGAASILHNFKYIKTEVSDFESYADCCTLTDIASFLAKHGYKECSRNKFAERAEGGSYYDVVYERIA